MMTRMSRRENGAGVAAAWPELAGWDETRDTLHMWTQIVGKVRLALEPMVNHWWQVPLYVSARGLTTSLMHAPVGPSRPDRRLPGPSPEGALGLEMEFDFVDHVLFIRTSTGEVRHVKLESRSVADFYAATMAALADLGIGVAILARPVEVPEAIPFAKDEMHHRYDADAAQRFWLALVKVHRVMSRFRAGFIGKVSPVHFFWGGFDLAVSRFSGRTAPKHPGGVPNCADWVMQLAYSHEEQSCGFWPGGGEEGSFYAYAYPEPEGFAERTVQPSSASYDHELREFLLPYAAVRTADDPDTTLLSFLQSTYDAAAELGRWDRASLEATDPTTRPIYGAISRAAMKPSRSVKR
jgi:hypothetical protein